MFLKVMNLIEQNISDINHRKEKRRRGERGRGGGRGGRRGGGSAKGDKEGRGEQVREMYPP